MWYNVAASLSTNDPQKDIAAEIEMRSLVA